MDCEIKMKDAGRGLSLPEPEELSSSFIFYPEILKTNLY